MRVVQFLQTPLKYIEENLENIKNQGFDVIQISPIQPLKEERCDVWWMFYQPCGFRIGNILGSKEDLISLCNKAHDYDLKVVADVICTHMGQNGNMMPHENVDEELVSNEHFWREKRNLQGDFDYNNRYNVTHYCAGNLPGLNLYNWDLQNIVIRFLNECIDCGVDGFRFDSGKSIPLPTDTFYNEHYLKDARSCDFLPRVLSNLKRQDLINYFEVLNVDYNLINNYSRYGYVLTDVETMLCDPNKMILFAESHDQYFNWKNGVISPISDGKISEMYKGKCYHYPNTLFYARPFSNEWMSDNVREGNNINKDKTYKKCY